MTTARRRGGAEQPQSTAEQRWPGTLQEAPGPRGKATVHLPGHVTVLNPGRSAPVSTGAASPERDPDAARGALAEATLTPALPLSAPQARPATALS